MNKLSSLSIKIFLLFSAFVLQHNCIAQTTDDPTRWSYEVKKTGSHSYQLLFHCSLSKPGWHIYALNPGGDGSLIPPTFSFDKATGVTLKGKITECGKMITTTDDFLGTLHFFSNTVDFVQEVTTKGPVQIIGTHQYQTCNDQMCLPPKTVKFSFVVR